MALPLGVLEGPGYWYIEAFPAIPGKKRPQRQEESVLSKLS